MRQTFRAAPVGAGSHPSPPPSASRPSSRQPATSWRPTSGGPSDPRLQATRQDRAFEGTVHRRRHDNREDRNVLAEVQPLENRPGRRRAACSSDGERRAAVQGASSSGMLLGIRFGESEPAVVDREETSERARRLRAVRGRERPRATSVAAPSPTIRPIASSACGSPPDSCRIWFADSARSRSRINQRAVQVEQTMRRNLGFHPHLAQEVGVSHTFTRPPADAGWWRSRRSGARCARRWDCCPR